MCWRDEVWRSRFCSFCGQTYFGDLGHRGCPAVKKAEDLHKEKITAIAQRHGWDESTARIKIDRTQEILVLKSIDDAIDFLLEAIPLKDKDTVDKLEEDNPPF